MKDFKLNKTVFKAQSFKEVEKSKLFDKDVSLADRISMSFHLTCSIHGIKEGDSLKVDRTIFSARKF